MRRDECWKTGKPREVPQVPGCSHGGSGMRNSPVTQEAGEKLTL